tara:strand:+ start:14071 stop:14424 length:354 start_codon:yes stop_codon:yes gene_type:complete
MNHKEYNELKKQLLDNCQKIMNEKQPEYTNNNQDVLYNFKSTAKRLKLEPIEVWGVFLDKHIQAILSHASNPNMHQAEPIESRYCDAINYLMLGFALHLENIKNKHTKLNLTYKTIE